MLLRSITRNAWLLAAFALFATGAVVILHWATAGRIAHQERAALENLLSRIVPRDEYDNKLYADCTRVRDPELLGSDAPITVYRARKGGAPVAAILTPVAPDGYSGSIDLLVGVYTDGRVAGVRVTRHNETPGLGDKIDERRSDWILGFRGKSLTDPKPEGWRVRKDGGEFDAFTGATITPRAVVKAVARSLDYFRRHRDALFSAANVCEE